MDLIHAFKDFDKDERSYEVLSSMANEIQKIIDKNGMADFLLIILMKK